MFGFPLDGLELRASDLDWSFGYGAALHGRGRDLLPLLAGRPIPGEVFSGAGTQRLGGRGAVTATAAGDDLSLTFAALADPTRRTILARLAAGEATVAQLAEPFALTQQAVSKHIKVLERAGLITRTQAAQSRPCRLEPARLDTAAAVDRPPAQDVGRPL